MYTVRYCTDIPDRIFYEWNPDYKELFLHGITQNVEQLCYKKSIDAKHQRESKQEIQQVKMN
jgi:hypothetical protein